MDNTFQDIGLLERVAFAGIPENVTDDFKRLSIVLVANTIKSNPNISKNHCYKMVKDKVTMDYNLFVSVLNILNIPFGSLKEHTYTRGGKRITHLTINNTDNLDPYLTRCERDYPEVLFWLNTERTNNINA